MHTHNIFLQQVFHNNRRKSVRGRLYFREIGSKLYNRDFFFLPLLPRPHYTYSQQLITFGGGAESDCPNQVDKWQEHCCLNSTLHIQCTNPSGFIRTGLRCSDSFQPLLLWNGTSYRWAGARRERRAGSNDFPAKPSQVPEPRPWVSAYKQSNNLQAGALPSGLCVMRWHQYMQKPSCILSTVSLTCLWPAWTSKSGKLSSMRRARCSLLAFAEADRAQQEPQQKQRG